MRSRGEQSAKKRPCSPRTLLARIFHKLWTERRSVAGVMAFLRPKPVTDRRSTLSPIQSACEICGLASPLSLRAFRTTPQVSQQLSQRERNFGLSLQKGAVRPARRSSACSCRGVQPRPTRRRQQFSFWPGARDLSRFMVRHPERFRAIPCASGCRKLKRTEVRAPS